ncbi:MAG: OmpA family protein [Fibrobacter sp.]|jgi:flagellar motor protein MotB|uniref:OmpA/MotB family protein n=1 Tax=unclassified Fibrobacter TaxID=2634177 RepID=UPI00091F0149|nr:MULTISPECIES: OmpA family protein [unclassified Fibrobacter]MBO6135367.1 OmpA family protein [Fibrobacter sp.]MBQ3721805.1 OmpA family protein [Fibrobacter sp.]MBQ9224870.1 OmpA family protein [Fibrobacter sp.]MBR2059810.1 OmpA family protein [Fibrobacter sp.]MBR2308595.1 OmpA family protein [Fibrobacter sp.]
MRLRREEGSNPWMAYTDLGIALVSLFILAFVAMATLKEQKAEDLTRTEEEVLSCQEEMRKIAAERNALLAKSLQTSIEAGLIALEDGKIQIQASFLFPTNGAKLTTEGEGVIKGISKGLLDALDTGDVIMVSGFTDDIPFSGSTTYTNWNLSTERAVNVVKMLIKEGFPSDRIFAAGFGEFQPKYPNDTEEHRRLNRRVEIGVTPLRLEKH